MSSEHLDPHDARALRLSTVMNRRLEPQSAEAADTPIATPESAMSLLFRLGKPAAVLTAAFLAAWAAAVYFPAWPWLVAKLAAL